MPSIEKEINGRKFVVEHIKDLMVAVKVESLLISIPVEKTAAKCEPLMGMSKEKAEGFVKNASGNDMELIKFVVSQAEVAASQSRALSKLSMEDLAFVNYSLFSGVTFYEGETAFPLSNGSSLTRPDIVDLDTHDQLFSLCIDVNFKERWGKKFPMFLAGEPAALVKS